MSTTWVFIGLLGGRELPWQLENQEKIDKLLLKDFSFALILFISIAIAIGVKIDIPSEFIAGFKKFFTRLGL